MGQKKAPKPNAYSMFVQDLQKQHPQKYRKMQDAFESAAPLWARMSAEQRKPYEDRANRIKGSSQRFTSQGVDLRILNAEEQSRTEAEKTEREEVQQVIGLASRRGTLANETFFIIHCNIFCHYPNMKRYYGAEIAVVCFNLKDGVKPGNVFHFMVKPGPLPMGYKFDAQQHSDNTHCIPIPTDDDEEDNTMEIYYALKSFLQKKNQGGPNLPILYASSKNVKVVKGMLDYWAGCDEDEDQTFRVYDLQKMFLELRNACAGEMVWSSLTFSDRELEKDVYDYTDEIACDFHAKTPKTVYCSKSLVTRYVYIVCDNCISDLGIEFICGQHVPKKSTIPQDKACGWSGARDSVAGSSLRDFDTDFDSSSMADTWEKSSVRSTSTVVSHFDDDFPSLGQRQRRNNNSNASETNVSASSSRSYAGVTTINTPQSFLRDMSHLSLQGGPSSSAGMGRGFRRREEDSDMSSLISGGSRSLASVGSDHLGAGKGRGFRPKNIPRPGQ
ncbi:unnamed protein product [Ceutorhynchus assimilis]|uniref:Uncharacterized protein n=1 Tax=Ceutorhynchus assimilis TaxID=467358 RepID=A0A9N9MGQ4_9CUCU|nr:unnamed protein product [Ceutorhynchus assimilis]